MKKTHIVFTVMDKNGKYYSFADVFRTGENIRPYFNRYNIIVAHIAEGATQAHQLARNGTQVIRETAHTLLRRSDYVLFSKDSQR